MTYFFQWEEVEAIWITTLTSVVNDFVRMSVENYRSMCNSLPPNGQVYRADELFDGENHTIKDVVVF